MGRKGILKLGLGVSMLLGFFEMITLSGVGITLTMF